MDTAFTLLVNGPWTRRAAKNLIRQLELQIDWLDETGSATEAHAEDGQALDK